MKRLALAAVCLFAFGCGGSSDSSTSRFAGHWVGTWVNTADSADAGTSDWTVSSSGEVIGQDFDPGRDTTFNVLGQIDATGTLQSTSTPGNGQPATLHGPFTIGNDGFLHGQLIWGVDPPLTYTYTFHRATN